MKKILALILLLSLLSIFACGRSSESELEDLLYDKYIDGMVEGEYQTYDEIFSVLYSSVPNKTILKLNQTNTQNQFSIKIIKKDEDYITCSLYLNRYTVESLLNDKNVYFAIYGMEEFDGDYYPSSICMNVRQLVRNSVIDDWSSHTVSADFLVYSSYKFLALLIVINGNIYAYKCTI